HLLTTGVHMFNSASRRRRPQRLALTGIAAASALVLAACGSNDDAEGPQADDNGVTTLTVGATPVPHGQILEYVSDELGEDAGLDIEVVEFDDFQLPNRQMDECTLDANYFQHVPFLDQQIEDHGYEISHGDPIHIEPYAVFSNEHDSAEDIEDGATIGITSDAGNQPRALQLLHQAELLEDIDDDSVDAAIINGNYFLDAGLDVADAIIIEDADDSPFANVLAWNSENDDNETIQKLDELLHSDEVAEYIEETWPEGEVIPAGQANDTADDDA